MVCKRIIGVIVFEKNGSTEADAIRPLMNQQVHIRNANASDIDRLVALINTAYAIERSFKTGERIYRETGTEAFGGEGLIVPCHVIVMSKPLVPEAQ